MIVAETFARELICSFDKCFVLLFWSVFWERGNFLEEQSGNKISASNSERNLGKRTEIIFHEVDWLLAFCADAKESLNVDFMEFVGTCQCMCVIYVCNICIILTYTLSANPKRCWEKLKLCQDCLLQYRDQKSGDSA